MHTALIDMKCEQCFAVYLIYSVCVCVQFYFLFLLFDVPCRKDLFQRVYEMDSAFVPKPENCHCGTLEGLTWKTKFSIMVNSLHVLYCTVLYSLLYNIIKL